MTIKKFQNSGKIQSAVKTETLPDINTAKGKQIAKNIANRVISGEITLDQVPKKYYSYVQGEVQGAAPVTKAISDFGNKVVEEVAPYAIGAAFGPVGLLSSIAGEAINGGVTGASKGRKDSWGDLIVDEEKHPVWNTVAEFTNPGYLVAGPLARATTAKNVYSIGTRLMNGETPKSIFNEAVKEFDRGIKNVKLQPAVGGIGQTIPFEPAAPDYTKIATTYHLDSRVKPLSRPISEGEIKGIPKGERNLQEPKNPIPITLVNRSDSIIPVEDEQFIFAAPDKAKKLASVHFTQHTPVTSHGYGHWNHVNNTLLLPYGNVRKVAPPLNIEVMDTFFPNYKGLKVSTKGAKVLTGDKKAFEYYKSKGVDVEYSQELADLRKRYDTLQVKLKNALDKRDYSPYLYLDKELWNAQTDEIAKLSDEIEEVESIMQDIHTEFAKNNRYPVTYEDMKKLEKIENLRSGVTPLREDEGGIWRELGFDYHSTPTTHFNLTLMKSSDFDFNTLPNEQKKFVKWLEANRSDYRGSRKGVSYEADGKRGVPKSLRETDAAQEDPYYWGYLQWNHRYNSAILRGDLEEAQRLRDLHRQIKSYKSSQTKLSDPITYTDDGKVIPIVKRDNPHNPDPRFKRGGTINANI